MNFQNSKTKYFYFGRHAMYAALQILDIKKGDEILTPAWDCDGTLKPFRKVGCKARFYKTNPKTFGIDLKNLESEITPKTKLIHIINHFGHPQPWNEIIKIRVKYGIPILEDNAYTFDTPFEGKKLGDFGDISFFSFRKLLPISSGAVLKINNKAPYHRLIKKPIYKSELLLLPYFISDILYHQGGNSLKRIWKLVKKKTIDHEFWYPLYSETLNNFPPGERNITDNDFESNPIKLASQFGILMLRFYKNNYQKKISSEKRKQYLFLANELSTKKGITIIHPEIADETIPHVFSVLIKKNRDFIFETLSKESYPVWIWPSLSSEILVRLSEFPDVIELGQQLLQVRLTGIVKVNYKMLADRIIELVSEIKLPTENII